ncbi:MAG: SGNH/GDSL hydrolase family protein, partial [Chloroflexota bacterium]
ITEMKISKQILSFTLIVITSSLLFVPMMLAQARDYDPMDDPAYGFIPPSYFTQIAAATPPSAAATKVAALQTASPLATGAALNVPQVNLTVSARAREIYQTGLKLGNNAKAFSKVGDCMSTTPFFLVSFDNSKQYRLPQNLVSLQETVDNFSGSFSRSSVAAKDGFSAASLLNPRWADPNACGRTEGPLDCELRINKPSLVIVSLGTNGIWLTGESFEDYMRELLNMMIKRGVLPILSTKGDNVEGDGRFNAILIKLAKEYDLPLWDYWTIAQALPKSGITDGQYQMEWAPPIFDDGLKTGWQLRNLSALQALDVVWRGVK